ncbi:MAG: prepilin-type cleavage/methylation domain-containing protein [Betaproteobacteria bacterium]|nr:prepilin-type cleavage/methylation domain-containing protein [Betaproteobacteria bacterium]
MAVVFFVVALLLGSILVPLATQVEQRQISETQKTLDEIKEALLGFAVANGYLPCPDKTTVAGVGTANDGIEDVDGVGACVATSQGNVPWATLGVGISDVWGNRFRYQVTPAFSQHPPTVFNLSTAANINVCRVACVGGVCPANTRLTGASPDGAVAIIISLGKNGFGAISASTGIANPAPTSADENENVSGPTCFASRTITPAGAAAGEFDDIVIWISRHVLFNRMVAAGKLP